MNLTSGTNVLIHAQAAYNNNDIAITPVGGNIRFIDLTNADLTKLESWEIRTADADIAVTATTYNSFEAVDAADLRLGEVISFFDSSDDYIGSGTIETISGTTVGYAKPKNEDDYAFTAVDHITLYADPLLLDERTKPIKTASFKYVWVQADTNLELSIENLHVGNCI